MSSVKCRTKSQFTDSK